MNEQEHEAHRQPTVANACGDDGQVNVETSRHEETAHDYHMLAATPQLSASVSVVVERSIRRAVVSTDG